MSSSLVHPSLASSDGPRTLVPAVVRAAALLDALARERQPMSMARLAEKLALPRSSVHGLCITLDSLGLLRRQPDGAFAIGPRVLHLAEAFVASTDVAHEFDALWAAGSPAPEETMLLSVLEGSEVMYLAVRNGTRPLGLAFSRGMRLPAHLAATGRAMLAFAEPAELRRLFGRRKLARMTARGPADVDALRAELAPYRRSGCSIDDENVRTGVYCLASPVFDASGRVAAAVGVCLNKLACSASELKRQRQRVTDAACTLSERVGGDWHAQVHAQAHAQAHAAAAESNR